MLGFPIAILGANAFEWYAHKVWLHEYPSKHRNAPFFTLGAYYSAWQYWSKHSKAHLDPEWAKQNLPWHYDHHMNSNQNANWCVTRPWFDYIMGTRIVGDPEIAESNPLGMNLPGWVERPVNLVARRVLPKAFRRLDENRREESQRQAKGQMTDIVAA